MNWKQAFALGLIAPGAWDGGREQWETVYEKTLSATNNDPLTSDALYNGYKQTESNVVSKKLFVGGDRVRVTINGMSAIYTADGGSSVAHIGNKWLGAENTDTTLSDDGGDFYVKHQSLPMFGYTTYHLTFFARTPGTYSVKIERLVT